MPVALAVFAACVLAVPVLAVPPACPGDLNGDGETTVNEVVTTVNAALTGCAGEPSTCPGDLNGDGQTTVNEVVAAVNAALVGCAFPTASVSSAVAKVKDLLVGLPPTDAEVQAVSADRAALPALVGQWMALPQYRDKMLAFFVTQFQQDQFEIHALDPLFDADPPFSEHPAQFLQNLQQSFARTALELIDEGEPFTATLTTTRFMMTPALMAVYAALDDIHVDDTAALTDLFARDHPTHVTLESSTPIPIDQVRERTSPPSLTFYDPTIAGSADGDCPSATVVYPFPAGYRTVTDLLFNYERAQWPPTCPSSPVPAADRYVTDPDFTTWKMVRIRQPRQGEPTTQMYDLPSMRAGHNLILHVPRVSFFTTPAFAARWPTNNDNQARVLLNQTLIVALGQPINLTNTTAPPSLEALDAAHAAPGTVCFSCHQSLDPMRQFFRHTYTLYLSQQDDPAQLAMRGQFGFHGVSGEGRDIFDLGTMLATHPLFATAWVQKLCTYATSQRCDETDPEFQRLVAIFTHGNYAWNVLVQALFSSPLVTYLEGTATAHRNGQSFPIARQAHLCAALSNRLGIADLCGLDANTTVFSPLVQTVAASWPSDQYSRGDETPALASEPSLLLRGGMENLCADLAERLVDSDVSALFQSSDSATAIRNLTTQLMGLTSDRAAAPQAILQDHFAAAVQTGAASSDALKSTFVLACLSPYVVGVGQ